MRTPRMLLRAVHVLRCTRGVSAIEFALFAPMLCLGLVMMVDVGVAVGTRMELDRNVRSGAQAAMSLNDDAEAIRAIISAAAGASAGDLQIEVERTCACGSVAVTCGTTCSVDDVTFAPSVFFEIAASRQQSGLILGERTIASGTRVQIR